MNSRFHPAANPSPVDIESIVRRVLRELQSGQQAAIQKRPDEPVNPGAFQFQQRVVTLDDLGRVPAGMKQIQLPAGGVVTPSVRDELRHRGIELLRCDSKQASAKQASLNRAAANPSVAESSAARRQSPYRRVHLLHDDTIDTGLHASVQKQVVARGVRLCDQAGVTVMLSARPATAVYRSIAANTSAVLINRLDDIERFKHELRPTVYVLDVDHLNWIAMVNAVVRIARRSEQPILVRPSVTVSGGQR